MSQAMLSELLAHRGVGGVFSYIRCSSPADIEHRVERALQALMQADEYEAWACPQGYV